MTPPIHMGLAQHHKMGRGHSLSQLLRQNSVLSNLKLGESRMSLLKVLLIDFSTHSCAIHMIYSPTLPPFPGLF